jgi:hypothetical protein
VNEKMQLLPSPESLRDRIIIKVCVFIARILLCLWSVLMVTELCSKLCSDCGVEQEAESGRGGGRG